MDRIIRQAIKIHRRRYMAELKTGMNTFARECISGPRRYHEPARKRILAYYGYTIVKNKAEE